MNNTYSKTLEDSLNQSCLERARIIAQIDRSLSVDEKKEMARRDPYFVVKEVAGIPMRRWLRVEEVRGARGAVGAPWARRRTAPQRITQTSTHTHTPSTGG